MTLQCWGRMQSELPAEAAEKPVEWRQLCVVFLTFKEAVVPKVTRGSHGDESH